MHRDIKPENLVVHREPSGRHVVKVCDFGVSAALEGPDELLEDTAGTPPFASPESFELEHDGFASDVWALGVTLYSFVHQTLPFDPAGDLEELIVNADPEGVDIAGEV